MTKPEVHIIPHLLARFYFWLTGWRVLGTVPPEPKFVIVAAPHTTNYDGLLLICASWIVRRQVKFMIKIEWTRGIVGPLVKAVGGLGIDRSSSHNMVEQMVDAFQKRDRLLLVVPPEGTRKKTNHWKTGFYWIAVGAKVPLMFGIPDYRRKVVDLTPPVFYPTGDIQADIEVIWSHFRDATARFPERVSDFKLRPSGMRPSGSVSDSDQ